jgi:hypothetical protein
MAYVTMQGNYIMQEHETFTTQCFEDLNEGGEVDASQSSAVRWNKYSLLHQARFLDDHEICKTKTTQKCKNVSLGYRYTYNVKSGAFNVTFHVYAFYHLQHGCVLAWGTISKADIYILL